MKKLSKIIFTVTALVICTGAVIFCCAFSIGRERLPRGAYVNGVCVGGMSFSKAKSVLRGGVLPQIKRGGEFVCPVRYYLNGAEEIADGLCAQINCDPTEPYAAFNLSGEPFTYYDGADGAACDKGKLLEDISASLNGDFVDVRICKRALKRKFSRADVEERTKKLYSFTTYFDGDNADRSANIRLAARKINGTTVKSGETFSFNGTVGARTEENGFRPAKIIENGKFVLGYGGGVCQVSTTLYNAVVLSGLSVEEYHPHSLKVSYVPPSRDAMVSGSYFDLKFKNTRLTPIYVRMSCNLSSITCTIYGQPDGYEYAFSSVVTGTLPRPQAVTVEGDEDKILSYGKEGLKSSGYLLKTRGGDTVSELLRKDEYAAVADVLQIKRKDGESAA